MTMHQMDVRYLSVSYWYYGVQSPILTLSDFGAGIASRLVFLNNNPALRERKERDYAQAFCFSTYDGGGPDAGLPGIRRYRDVHAQTRKRHRWPAADKQRR